MLRVPMSQRSCAPLTIVQRLTFRQQQKLIKLCIDPGGRLVQGDDDGPSSSCKIPKSGHEVQCCSAVQSIGWFICSHISISLFKFSVKADELHRYAVADGLCFIARYLRDLCDRVSSNLGINSNNAAQEQGTAGEIQIAVT